MIKSFSDLTQELSELRGECVRSIDMKFKFSRGTWLTGIRFPDNGEKFTEDGDYRLTTKKQLLEGVEQLTSLNADVIYIEGLYDGADSIKEYADGVYQPCVGEWDLEIWNKKDGWLI